MSIYQSQEVSFKPTYLYIKQHAITGKYYFGKTNRDDPGYYPGSGPHWKNHFKKHGKEHVETLWYCLFHDQEECTEFALSCSEQWDIVKSDNWLNKIPEDGINAGGFYKGHIPSLDTKAKIGKAHKGRILSTEHKAKISKTNKNPSIEIRLQISEASKGRICSIETKKKMSITRKGIKFDQSHKNKIGEAVRSRIISEETKRKMSESGKHRAKPSIETLNKKSIAMSTTRWINKDGTNKRAQLNILQELLNSGWNLGKLNNAL